MATVTPASGDLEKRALSSRTGAVARRAVRAAFLGFFVDMFDIYLPIIVLPPAFIYFVPASVSSEIRNLFFYITFAASLLGRPVGAFIFGHLGDKLGRQRTLRISVASFTVITLAMAALPGYESSGLLGVWLFIVLRFFDGIALGGEYTAANPLAMEYSAKQERGFNGALITSGYAVASIAISVVAFLTLRFAPAGGIDAPYVRWGWRVPFVIGALLSFALFLYVRRSVPESKLWIEVEKAQSPLLEMIRGKNGASLRQAFVLMSGVWLVFLAVAGTLPTVLVGQLHIPGEVMTGTLIIANFVLFFGYLMFGVLGQRFGRRAMLIVGAILNLLITPILYYVLIKGWYQSKISLIVLVTILEVFAVAGTLAIPLAYLTERFSTNVRASGFGVAWSLSLVLPSFYSFYMQGLSALMPYAYSQIVLVVVGSVIMIFGAAMGPETRHLDLTELGVRAPGA